MASLETIGPLMTGMKIRADMAGLACEALNRMFQKEQTELVAQVNCCVIAVCYSILFLRQRSVNITSLIYRTGSTSGAGAIFTEAAGRNRTGDDRKPLSDQGSDSKGSQVHDSQFAVRRTGMTERCSQTSLCTDTGVGKSYS